MQTRKTLRNPAYIQALMKPGQEDQLFENQLGSTFEQAIRYKHVDEAFKLWSQDAEHLLKQIAQTQGHHISTFKTKMFPCSVQSQFSTLQQRKIFKGLNRALQVQLAAPEYRRDRTWSLIHEVLPYLSPTSQVQVAEILSSNPPQARTKRQLIFSKRSYETTQPIIIKQEMMQWKHLPRKNRCTIEVDQI